MSRQRLNDDDESLLLQGASLAQLAVIFSMDSRDIKMKIFPYVKPVGKRRGFEIFPIGEAAPYLVKPPYTIDEFVQRMSSSDLPPALRKDYWAAQRSRQLWEKEAAELWPTARVVDVISDLLKTLRLSLLMTREAAEREVELTDRQRAIITRIIDNALKDAHEQVNRNFTEAKTAALASAPAAVRPDLIDDQEEL